MNDMVIVCKVHGNLGIDNLSKHRSRCKKCLSDYNKKYRDKNKKYFSDYNKQYRINNKEKIKSYDQKQSAKDRKNNYRINNKEKIKSYKKEYSRKNSEMIKFKNRENYKKYIKEMSNSYCKSIIRNKTKLSFTDIPNELVEMQRASLSLKRFLRSIKKNEKKL